MSPASTVLLSKLALSKKVANTSSRALFGMFDKSKLKKEWDNINFQFLVQYSLDNCTTYTSKQIEDLNGILTSLIYR